MLRPSARTAVQIQFSWRTRSSPAVSRRWLQEAGWRAQLASAALFECHTGRLTTPRQRRRGAARWPLTVVRSWCPQSRPGLRARKTVHHRCPGPGSRPMLTSPWSSMGSNCDGSYGPWAGHTHQLLAHGVRPSATPPDPTSKPVALVSPSSAGCEESVPKRPSDSHATLDGSLLSSMSQHSWPMRCAIAAANSQRRDLGAAT